MSYIFLIAKHTSTIAEVIEYLENSGHKVAVTDSGQDALNAIQAGKEPDILFVEEWVVELHAYEVLGMLREMRSPSMTKVLVGMRESATGVPFQKWNLTASGFIMMPYTRWQLILSIEQLIYRNVSME